jgi:dTDP-4-amino-4,6-dideoxygalactose transaminase
MGSFGYPVSCDSRWPKELTVASVPFVDLRAQYRGIAAEINRSIQEVLERADFILGEAVEKFEGEFASYTGVEHPVGVVRASLHSN